MNVVAISLIVLTLLLMVRNHIIAHVDATGRHIWCRSGAKLAVTNIAHAPATLIRLAGYIPAAMTVR